MNPGIVALPFIKDTSHEIRISSLVVPQECYPQTQQECNAHLYASRDFGSSWQAVTNASRDVVHVSGFSWLEGESAADEVALITGYSSWERFHQRPAGFDPNMDLMRIHIGASAGKQTAISTTQMCANDFITTGNRVYAIVPRECQDCSKEECRPKGVDITSKASLRVSSDGGQSFEKACFPGDVEQEAYHPVQEKGRMFMPVRRKSEYENVPEGNLYASDESGKLYTLHLKHLFYPPSPTYQPSAPDLSLLPSTPSVAIANHIHPSLFPDFIHMAEVDAWEYRISKISTNGGATWGRPKLRGMSKPSPGDDGEALHLTGASELHLTSHGRVYWHWSTPTVHSVKSAPGLVISTGSWGKFLEFDPRKRKTYISTDFGTTWDMLDDGLDTYEITNSGGAIAFARHAKGATNVSGISYSLDQGKTKRRVDFPFPLSEVHNIRTDPNHNGTSFIVLGTKVDTRSAVLVKVDLKRLHEGKDAFSKCTEDDFEETEVLSDSGGCLRGRNATLSARKEGKECRITEESDVGMRYGEECECKEMRDFECAFGYERGPDGECREMSSAAEECPHEVEEESSSRLRLTPGNQCANPQAILNPSDDEQGGSNDGGDESDEQENGDEGEEENGDDDDNEDEQEGGGGKSGGGQHEEGDQGDHGGQGHNDNDRDKGGNTKGKSGALVTAIIVVSVMIAVGSVIGLVAAFWQPILHRLPVDWADPIADAAFRVRSWFTPNRSQPAPRPDTSAGRGRFQPLSQDDVL